MSAQQKSIPDITVANSVTSNVRVLVVSDDTTRLISANQIPMTIGATPANSSATTIASGLSWTDGNYLYVATSNNVVKRVALSSF